MVSSYMKKKKIFSPSELFFVLTLAIIVSILVMLHVIVGAAKTLPNYIYLWTGHYYLDYFYYLTPIAQGIRGHWLSFQQGAIGDNVKYPHLMPYILIGQFARLFRLTAVSGYWLSIFVTSFLLVILFYFAIKKILYGESFITKIAALLLTLFSGSFFTVQIVGKTIQISNYEFWYSIGNFFRRFEPVPHHILSFIFTLFIVLVCGEFVNKVGGYKFKDVVKKSLVMSTLFVGLLSFNSYSIVVPFIAMGVTVSIYLLKTLLRRERTFFYLLFFLGFVTAAVGFSAFLLKTYYNGTSFMAGFKNVEIYLHQSPGLKLVFLNTGPIIILSLLGIRKFIKKIEGIKITLLVFLLSSYILYFSPLDKILGTHNGRFLSTVNYLFFGVIGALGLLQISEFFKKHSKSVMIIFLMIFLLYSTPPAVKSFSELIEDRNIFSPITYLPVGIVKGFKKLDRLPKKGNVLVTPSQFLGTVLPVYSDRKVYVARQIVTPDYIEKNIKTSNFYIGAMTNDQALNLLKKNGIAYVVLTSIEGYDSAPLYHYPFLKEVYKNESIIIFQVV